MGRRDAGRRACRRVRQDLAGHHPPGGGLVHRPGGLPHRRGRLPGWHCPAADRPGGSADPLDRAPAVPPVRQRRAEQVRAHARRADPGPGYRRPQAARWWQRLRHRLTAAETWKQLGYALVRFPLSTAELALVISAWSFALAMIAFPAYNGILPRGSTVLGRGHAPVGARDQVLVAAGGLILLLAAPHVTRGMALADVAVARLLLGPPRRADLRARIGELELSRARVVDSAEA